MALGALSGFGRPGATDMRSNVVDALLPIGALIGALLLFGLFVWLVCTSPTETWRLLFE